MKAIVIDQWSNIKGVYPLAEKDSHHYIEEIPHIEEGDVLNIVSDEDADRLEYGS